MEEQPITMSEDNISPSDNHHMEEKSEEKPASRLMITKMVSVRCTNSEHFQ